MRRRREGTLEAMGEKIRQPESLQYFDGDNYVEDLVETAGPLPSPYSVLDLDLERATDF